MLLSPSELKGVQMTNRIEINPQVMMGKPVIRGTRIPVEFLLRKISEGASEDDLLDAYIPGFSARTSAPPSSL